MKKIIILTGLLLYSPVWAMFTLTSPAFNQNGNIPYKYGLCKPDGQGAAKPSDNISPPLVWSGMPTGTKSFVLLMLDHNIPQKSAIKNSSQVLPKNFPRQTGYYWVLINIASAATQLPENAGPEKTGASQYGIQGKNYYTMVSGADLGGYSGPCPYITDKITHHYVFHLYALDVSRIDLPSDGNFTGSDVLQAIKGHVLGEAVLVGHYPMLVKLSRAQS